MYTLHLTGKQFDLLLALLAAHGGPESQALAEHVVSVRQAALATVCAFCGQEFSQPRAGPAGDLLLQELRPEGVPPAGAGESPDDQPSTPALILQRRNPCKDSSPHQHQPPQQHASVFVVLDSACIASAEGAGTDN